MDWFGCDLHAGRGRRRGLTNARAAALRLGRGGWRVFAGVRREEDAAALRGGASECIVPVMLDVTDAEQIAAAVRTVEAEVGEAGLDGLVNNAGIAVLSPLETIPVDDFRRQLEVNLVAPVAVTQAFLPHRGDRRLRRADRLHRL